MSAWAAGWGGAARQFAVLSVVVALAGCGAGGDGGGEPSPARSGASSDAPSLAGDGPSIPQRFPDILSAQLTRAGPTGSYDVTVTVSSPYDSADRYADGWRVLAPDGTVLGEHTLLHDHAGEQPFTRTQTGLDVPAGVERVIIEGRDQRYGYGGTTTTVAVPR